MTALLEKKNQEALIRRAERPEEVKIVKPALLPTHPINPPKTVTTGAMGVIIGLILGIVIGFIVETFDTSLGAIEDVEETLGTPVLGIIPHVDIRDIRESLKKKYPEGISLPDETHMSYLISHFVPKSMMAESFRALRTNVQFKDAGKKTKTIAVTSSSPQEGKTLVAINLAIAMAQARMKVLLIGSDLRKPTIDRVFDLEMTPGLTDILMENYHWRDTVKTVMDMVMGKMTQTQVIRTPGLDNLHIITSGPIPPNPAELIDSPGFRDLIEEAKKEYDIIIFDSPPILSTADAAILGAKVDGVLLVYRVGTVSRGLLKRSTTQLEQVECNLMGVILNGMRPEVSPDFQDYKYYTYYYSYGEEGEGKKRGERKKRLAFLRRKGDSPRREAQKTSLGEKGEAPQVEPRKKINMVRLALLLVAIAFLAVGILWQSGIIEPFKQSGVGRPVRKDKVKTAVKKEISKTAIGRELKKGPKKPKTEAPVEKARAERVMSISKSRPVAKAMEETKTPVVTKRTSTQPIPKKPEAISKEPKPTVVDKSAAKGINSVKKDASDTAIREKPKTVSTKPKSPIIVKEPELQPERVTSIPKSPPDAKVVADTKTPASSEKIASHPYSLLLYHFRSLERAKNAVSLYN
ncbi:MAG: polysaccharide biosynthesis tyrosine autokinase, partial [Deltaproteobacteria bacterium]